MKLIEKVVMEMDANTSAKTVTPVIEDIFFNTPTRAFNQKEIDIFHKLRKGQTLPSQIIDINRLITNKTMDALNKDFKSQRKSIINKRNKLNSKGLILFSPIIDKSVQYKDTNLFTLLNLQLESNLKVISLPDFNTRIGEFKQILKLAMEHLETYPTQEFYVLQHVISNSKDFNEKITHLVDLKHRAFALDFWSYANSIGNLNFLQNFIRKSGLGLWVHSCNVERYLHNTNASLPHVLTFYGVDSYSKRMFDIRSLFDPKEGKMREIVKDYDSIKYFHEDTVGIWLKSELPDSFIKKLKQTGVISGGFELRNDKSKLYEMESGQIEFNECNGRIKKGEYLEYVAEKKCLKNTIQNKKLF